MKNIKIINHGVMWINEGKALYCPECSSSEIECEIDVDSVIKKYTAICKCEFCLCSFKISKEDF